MAKKVPKYVADAADEMVSVSELLCGLAPKLGEPGKTFLLYLIHHLRQCGHNLSEGKPVPLFNENLLPPRDTEA